MCIAVLNTRNRAAFIHAVAERLAASNSFTPRDPIIHNTADTPDMPAALKGAKCGVDTGGE